MVIVEIFLFYARKQNTGIDNLYLMKMNKYLNNNPLVIQIHIFNQMSISCNLHFVTILFYVLEYFVIVK